MSQKPKRKFEYVFISAKPGQRIGRIVARDTLESARKERYTQYGHGYKVSKIAKRGKK